MDDFTAVILAAGEGKRMKSDTPKVMHKICGIPMLGHVIRAAKGAGASRIVIVIGKHCDVVVDAFKDDKDVTFVLQEQQKGTGHALMQAKEVIKENTLITVLYGDMPMITSESISEMVDFHKEKKADATVMTAEVEDPTGYGRIIGDGEKVFLIREEKDASEEEKAIKEINSGFYCFESSVAFDALEKIDNDNKQAEYYLTDIVEVLNKENKDVLAFRLENPEELNGVNDRCQLAHVQKLLQKKIISKHMQEGVTFLNPDTNLVDIDVEIGRDTVIYPGVILEGKTKIGQGCSIVGASRIIESDIGNNVQIVSSQIQYSSISDNVKIGPFANLRPDCEISSGVKIGDFVELKNTKVGKGTKIPHLSYLGDATLGENINIGAGVIIVNYDGYKKHPTIIKDNAFIGCNSNLVAPVCIEEGSFVAAGSTITKNVPKDSLAIARDRQVNKIDWVKKRRQKIERGNSSSEK